MSFKHRLENNDLNKLCSVELVDAIHSMTKRAEAVITLLESEFIFKNENPLNNEIMLQALQSVRMEIIDIRITTNKYHDYQREQGVQNVTK